MKTKTVLTTITCLALGLFLIVNTGCKKKKGCTDAAANNYNADADEDDGSCTYDAGTSPIDLLAKWTDAAPSIDGSVDAGWADCQTLMTTATVPDPGQDVFQGYVGNSIDVSMRAMYDANNIYFLAEWADTREDWNRDTWYFDPTDTLWKEESNKPVFENGVQVRQAFYEDKFAMLFNVDNSVPNWNSLACYATCHTGLSEADGKARHYTGSGTEFIDMWHWKYVRSNINDQADDQFQNDTYPNGRHGDTKTGGGYHNNTQELTVTGGTDLVDVPKYFIPGRTNYGWITQAEVDAGTAALITAVDANGVLTYAGGTIDPFADTDFQRAGATTGPKCIPSVYTTAFEGSRGDISAKGIYTGTGWVLEMSRALNTGETEHQDVEFDPAEEFVFGIGVFDNAAIAHAIKPGLVLKFEQ